MDLEVATASTVATRPPGSSAKADPSSQPAPAMGLLVACFHSGLLSALMFLVAMLLYNMSIPLGRMGFERAYSWLNFWGALLFAVEALLDIYWSVFCQPAKEELAVEGKRTRRVSDISQASTVTALRRRAASDTSAGYMQSAKVPDTRLSTAQARCVSVDWELWSAVFFFIASLFYVVESFMDPVVVGKDTVAHMRSAGLNVTHAVAFCDWAAVLIFIFDAGLRIVSRVAFHRTSSSETRPILIQIWQADNWQRLDWITWGDVAFMVGAWMEFVVKVDARHAPILVPLSSGLWTLDALFYVIGSIPSLRELRRRE